ncbi:MAG: electron transfer flavoprotein subunit alpha/FixB family protein [Schleiferiaceae bacterium]|jgi:electron transfer flavoprotein alpha subunit|nr:electron transfer flavoprotein subunit alpha/FixB family protein [Schleiferiaceae bacterium]
MSVFVYVEDWNGAYKKSSFEAVSYARIWANSLNTSVTALTSSVVSNPSVLGEYGADHVLTFEIAKTGFGLAQQLQALIQNASGVVISGTNFGKSVAPAFTALISGALSSNTTSTPITISPLTVKRGAFSSKGIETIELSSEMPIICFVPNSIGVQEFPTACTVTETQAKGNDLLSVEEITIASGKIALPEADVVVSAGRGLKGPEHWGMIEALADVLGAATACSKPVSDIGWRPHNEHVGQTGIQVNPNLYIAIGISGAIQHLAGVSASKTIVVVNTDPEAPFFKAADYGIVGDAFQVVPKLVDTLRAFKADQ